MCECGTVAKHKHVVRWRLPAELGELLMPDRFMKIVTIDNMWYIEHPTLPRVYEEEIVPTYEVVYEV